MTSSYYGVPVPVPPRRKSHAPKIIAAAVVAVALLCGLGMWAVAGIGSAAQHTPNPFTTQRAAGAATPATKTLPPAVETEGRLLVAGDLALTAKITKRECFGGVVCNVEYRMDLSIARAPDDEWTVTYTVHGFVDGDQIGTIELGDDGKYSQDPYLSGQVKSAKTKLTVKITDLERA